MLYKIVGLNLLLMALSLLDGCSPAMQQNLAQETSPQISSSVASPQPLAANRSAFESNATEHLIWSEERSSIIIRWTTNDLYVQSASGTERIFAPLAEREFRDFAADLIADARSLSLQSGQEVPMMQCDYRLTFKLLSVVGTLVSFEDQYGLFCGTLSLGTRFATIDLAKPGQVLYVQNEADVNSANPSKIVKLTDYFVEEDVLRALLADRVIQSALRTLNTSAQPQTLTELPELFAGNDYELGDTGFELRPDFLTRFVFHHIEGDRVAIRIGLPPHYGANSSQHQQLGILLPIPNTLRQPLTLAAARQEGFLMRDATRIAGNQSTEFNFRTGDGVERRR